MSLRLRLIGLVAMALVISLLLAGAIACYNASGSVGIEMRSALLVGRRAVENAAAGIQASPDPRRDLERLIGAVPRQPPHSGVARRRPGGGRRAAGRDLSVWRTVRMVRAADRGAEHDRARADPARRPDFATVVLEADPHNETLDVWNDFNNTVIVLLVFSGLTILLIYLFIGRALRPLYRLGAALEQIGRGNFTMRVGGRLTPELSGLHDNFNRMAGQLAAADADNRRLNEQLLTVQERERGEIARDLHDEVGPYLFAINIDTDAVSRLLKAGRAAEAADISADRRGDRHMQRELHGVVRRLQPVGLAEFGLPDAIDDMIQFWRRRHPDIDFRVTVAPGCDALGELVDTTIYRVVQECLSNALRHGRPTSIAVRVECAAERGQIFLEIADDGSGMPDASTPALACGAWRSGSGRWAGG